MSKKDFSAISLDVRPDRLDLRDREYRPPLKDLPNSFPLDEDALSLFEHYTKECGLILDQGEEGACTGFGLAAVINYLRWKEKYVSRAENNKLYVVNTDIDTEDDGEQGISPVSERMLYHNARIYDEWDGSDYEGSSCRGAMKGWHRHGVCDRRYWPYRTENAEIGFVEPDEGWAENAAESPLGCYYRVDKDSVMDMQFAIFEVGAIYCSAVTHNGWHEPTPEKKGRGYYDYLPIIAEDYLTMDTEGGHAFAIVGYTRDGFIVQNSWGSAWGFEGFALLQYSDWLANGMDAWVAVRGASTGVTRSPATVVHQALQDNNTGAKDTAGLVLQKVQHGFPYKHKNIKPWGEEDAYRHTLVLGNNGKISQKLIDTASPEGCIKKIGGDYLTQWMKETKNVKVVIYAHGGLNAEKHALRRVQIMGPYFLENGIYPIFINWRSGFLETLDSIVEDAWLKLTTNPKSGRPVEGVGGIFLDRINSGIEVSARKFGAKSLWTEMKENAAHASAQKMPTQVGTGEKSRGALVNLISHLSKHKKLELHVVAHSAGAIMVGEMLPVLTKRKIKLHSMTLFAPACTVDFANKYFQKAVESKTIERKNIHFEILSTSRERSDSVGAYGKSLLFLISRALEDIHKAPLLGLEATWNRDSDGTVYKDKIKGNITDEHKSRLKVIDNWLEFWGNAPKPFIHDKNKHVSTSTKGDQMKLSHGSFDNDIDVIGRTIKRIANVKTLKYKVENLGGF